MGAVLQYSRHFARGLRRSGDGPAEADVPVPPIWQELQRRGFRRDIIIWDRRQDYNNFRPLGYPAVFRVNKAHEFILIFQKPR
jgi:hypothetical protein